ncbi:MULTISPECIES: hypothetical protein [unclassified Pseudomonas]|uniref:hypothetical protein n=1 Tax=unclassified Pseudomonas TaxID=196821 RepID=UPI00224997C2|nr:hypothetical protein [Pseudomonas sp. DCB_BG]MCX2708364.1 hypothetical protein [Pseudomonas sp. DCB_BG]
MKMDVKRLESLIKGLKAVDGSKVEIGFFEDSTYPNGTPVALVAAWNEYGTRFHPERPFMRETFTSKEVQALIQHRLKSVLAVALNGGRGIQKLLADIGKQIEAQMKDKIEHYPGHNSLATIMRKGFDDPLKDTGKMLESVKFKISQKGMQALGAV